RELKRSNSTGGFIATRYQRVHACDFRLSLRFVVHHGPDCGLCTSLVGFVTRRAADANATNNRSVCLDGQPTAENEYAWPHVPQARGGRMFGGNLCQFEGRYA